MKLPSAGGRQRPASERAPTRPRGLAALASIGFFASGALNPPARLCLPPASRRKRLAGRHGGKLKKEMLPIAAVALFFASGVVAREEPPAARALLENAEEITKKVAALRGVKQVRFGKQVLGRAELSEKLMARLA